MKIHLITGASSGLGLELAKAALARGDAVAAVARRVERLTELAKEYPERVLPVAADLLHAEARESAVKACLERWSRIDVLVNNAGRGSLGAAEEFAASELRAQLELNFIACAEMIRLCLPAMRAAGRGHVVNVSSIGGRVNVGGFSAYGAAKFALEGYSEALADEVRPFGIGVTVVEPGALRTEFAGDSNVRPAQRIAAYDPVLKPIRDYLYGSAGKQSGDPAKAAAVILEAILTPSPPLRLLLGADAYGLWDAKESAHRAELEAWRARGREIQFSDGPSRAIGKA